MTADEVSADEVCEFTDIESGVEYLRSRMVEIANVVSLTFRGDAASLINYSELYTGATEHTGVPNEGDYIVKHFGRYSCSTTSGIDDVGQFCTITYNFTWYTTREMEDELTAEIDRVLDSLNLEGLSDYDKIKIFY